MSDTVIEVATFLLHGVRTLLAYIVLDITSHLRCIALLYFAIRLESRKGVNKRIYLSITRTYSLCRIEKQSHNAKLHCAGKQTQRAHNAPRWVKLITRFAAFWTVTTWRLNTACRAPAALSCADACAVADFRHDDFRWNRKCRSRTCSEHCAPCTSRNVVDFRH